MPGNFRRNFRLGVFYLLVVVAKLEIVVIPTAFPEEPEYSVTNARFDALLKDSTRN